jgi:hypothetical protein
MKPLTDISVSDETRVKRKRTVPPGVGGEVDFADSCKAEPEPRTNHTHRTCYRRYKPSHTWIFFLGVRNRVVGFVIFRAFWKEQE